MVYHFRIHKESGGYWAECVELKNCLTEAQSREELTKNMEEALNLHLSEPEDSKVIFPLPKKRIVGKNVVGVPVDVHVAIACSIRRYRLRRHWTQKYVAKLLGKGLFSYQRLENPKTANPEWETLVAIKQKAFPEMKLDELIA